MGMTLEAFALTGYPQPLVPATAERDWMNIDRHAYRCLPLTIGNTYGWQLLLPADVTASWNGGGSVADISVSCERYYQAVSNFSNAILTFDVGYLFRTPPGFHLLVTGPSNSFKDGIAPMTAVVETDWLPYTFTMNYRFTRPGQVKWQAGEPYAQICVIKAGIQEDVQPVIRKISEDKELAANLFEWTTKRVILRDRLASSDSKDPWDKDYFLGRYANGQSTNAEHTRKLKLKTPVDKR